MTFDIANAATSPIFIFILFFLSYREKTRLARDEEEEEEEKQGRREEIGESGRERERDSGVEATWELIVALAIILLTLVTLLLGNLFGDVLHLEEELHALDGGDRGFGDRGGDAPGDEILGESHGIGESCHFASFRCNWCKCKRKEVMREKSGSWTLLWTRAERRVNERNELLSFAETSARNRWLRARARACAVAARGKPSLCHGFPGGKAISWLELGEIFCWLGGSRVCRCFFGHWRAFRG